MPPNKVPSFGIELEFDHLKSRRHNSTKESSLPKRYARSSTWGYQEDYTAGTELRSPIFTSIDKASKSIDKTLKVWKLKNSTFVPYMRGTGIGQHMHIGKTSGLTRFEMEIVASFIYPVYPYLIALHTNTNYYSKESSRVLTSRWCTPTRRISPHHYSDVSMSSHNTVELRAFDSNIPQVSLLVASLILPLLNKALNNGNRTHRYSASRYLRERREAASDGFKNSLSGQDFLEDYFYTLGGDLKIDTWLPSSKELLYLAICHKLTAQGIFLALTQRGNTSCDDYHYFDKMTSKSYQYFSLIKQLIKTNSEITSIVNSYLDDKLWLSDYLDYNSNFSRTHLYGALLFKRNDREKFLTVLSSSKFGWRQRGTVNQYWDGLVEFMKATPEEAAKMVALPKKDQNKKRRVYDEYCLLLRPEIWPHVKEIARMRYYNKPHVITSTAIPEDFVMPLPIRIFESSILTKTTITRQIGNLIGTTAQYVLDSTERYYVIIHHRQVLACGGINVSTGRQINIRTRNDLSPSLRTKLLDRMTNHLNSIYSRREQ